MYILTKGVSSLGWLSFLFSYDETVVFASQLGQVALDAHMAMLNIAGLTFMTGPMAFGIAANVRVGNLLGGGDPATARVAAAVSVFIGAG